MIRVLIVDDDYMVARVHRQYVEKIAGFEVVGVALNGAEALSLVESANPDLVLLDIYLPDVSGIEVMRRIRLDHGADVITITAARDIETLRAAMQFGAVHYLVKPFSFPALRQWLQRYAQWAHQFTGARGAVDQAAIDRMVGALRSEPIEREIPKGMSDATMELIVSIVGAADGEISAAEVADGSGVSRVTARRYLEHLRRSGRIGMRLRYGSSGRPTHLYFADPD